MTKIYSITLMLVVFLASFEAAHAYTANQVTFQFLESGRFRVKLYYTVPALKEFREAYVDFDERKKAEAFYFDVMRGADFYLEDEPETKFINEPLAPNPW